MKKTIFFVAVLSMIATQIALAKTHQSLSWLSVASTKITKGLIEQQPLINVAAPLKSEKKMMQLFSNILLSTGIEIKVTSVLPQANQTNGSIEYTFLVWYQETKAKRVEVKEKIKALLPGLFKTARTPLEKELAINDYLCRTVSYDENGKDNTAYDALFYHTSLCGGIAWLASEMLIESGIQNRIIIGRATNFSDFTGYHAWLEVKIGQTWTMYDPTWCIGNKNHLAFFDVSGKQLSKTHSWNASNFPIANKLSI